MRKLVGTISIRKKVTDRSATLENEEKMIKKKSSSRKDSESQRVATVRDTCEVNLSLDFQSIRVGVSVEMPFYCEPGDTKTVKKWMGKVEKLVDDKIAEKVEESQATLTALSASNKKKRKNK